MQKYDTIIIGTGCAGYNAADWLYTLGHRNIAVITEGVKMGTSRNTGSDKQTYYKLSLASDGSDSVAEMARTLFEGGSVNGDIALTEAACSVRSFMKLVNLGVPFPTNSYGEFVGYKTDHDPRQRATSCGPLTSKLMVEALEAEVMRKNIPVLDQLQVIRLLCSEGRIQGLAAISTQDSSYHIFACDHVILATGGPAGVYYNSVYPESQTGGTGLALEAGARAANLQEWQYGIASVKFRWNMSGTYQQVLPKYIAVDAGGREREFLPEYFQSPAEALNMVFLKGYQWPFDTRRIDGSSRIDRIIHEELVKGNRVYMDFRSNPTGLENGFDGLSGETYQYLEKSNALFGTPIERLLKMNPKAIEIFAQAGIDLYREAVEVAVCAQHCNGGIDVDINWQSSIEGLYVAGEAAGTFGIYRPGGSALNSTQVGAMRAAEHIAFNRKERNNRAESVVSLFTAPKIRFASQSNVVATRLETQKLMSRYAAFMRSRRGIDELLEKFTGLKQDFFERTVIRDWRELPYLHKTYDILLTQISVLSAMQQSAHHIGTRGAGLVIDSDLPGQNRYTDQIIITENGHSHFEQVRQIPVTDNWFENVWNEFNRKRGL
ncbi:MAG: FAD-binding protein [Clostridiales bacterium]|nr:FAD-binding protein [Clostridiales bacterium]